MYFFSRYFMIEKKATFLSKNKVIELYEIAQSYINYFNWFLHIYRLIFICIDYQKRKTTV